MNHARSCLCLSTGQSPRAEAHWLRYDIVNVPVYTHVTEPELELKLLRSLLIVSQRRYILGSTLLRSLQLTPATAEELPSGLGEEA